MFSQVELGFGRIPLKLERHPRTLHHGKSWVYRHDVRAHELHPAITIACKMNLIWKSPEPDRAHDLESFFETQDLPVVSRKPVNRLSLVLVHVK